MKVGVKENFETAETFNIACRVINSVCAKFLMFDRAYEY